ncbi:MAG TPA: transglycosylase SLT domain-containing protein [Gemmatimonadales bacterium]|nr:transglycosylase SLT domain-containing protein [Gemmatimonadales bacterium]
MTQLLHLWLWLAAIGAGPRPHHFALPDSGEVRTALDSTLAQAGDALARGRPWQATRLLSHALRDSSNRTPAALYLAATAASEWGGWSEVTQLLSAEPWIDSLYDGGARLLLTRAALERHADSAALSHASAAWRVRPSSAERLILLATALDRNGFRDSAAAVYRRAAGRVPEIADWLRLRAAAVTADSTARAKLYEAITDLLPRSRIPWAEAAAYEQIGDQAGAARRYAELGEHLTSLRLRLAASPDSEPRAAIRREVLGLLNSRMSSGAARQLVALVDSSFRPLAPAEELRLAQIALDAGMPSRAAAGFARAGSAQLGRGEHRFAYATALTRLKRNAEAAVQFRQVRTPQRLAALSAYQGARALVRDGQVSRGRKALIEVARTYKHDTTAAASAYFLLADLASDNRAEAEARRLYRVVANRYPTSRFAPTARFRAGMIVLLGGNPKLAAREFDLLAERHPGSDEALGAIYWAGRAWAAAGDTVRARTRWQTVATRDPLSYYAALSAKRLGDGPPWSPAAAPDSFASDPLIDQVVRRAPQLSRLGMRQEARWELDRLVRAPDTSSERLLILANAFRSQGMASQAIQLARRALAQGAPPDARTYRLIYPIVHVDALLAEAGEQGVDPTFVAALIRQESNFNPGATSPAGARGLAQVMPELGERLAKELNYPVWDPVLLYQPDVSIQLGAFHLRELLGRYDKRAHILAAYNAGAPRVERWSKRIGVDDPEVFAEQISFVETRDYVRIIQRNVEIYRALYGEEISGRRQAVVPAGSPENVATSQDQPM